VALDLDLKEVTTQFYFGEHQATYPKPPGRGAGNLIFLSGSLHEWAEPTRDVGTNRGVCKTVADHHTAVGAPEGPGIGVPAPTPDRRPASIAQCQQTLVLEGGTLLLEGLLDQVGFEGPCAQRLSEQFCSGSEQALAVTGGTGIYAGARGTAQLQQIEYPDVIRIRIDGVVPPAPSVSARPAATPTPPAAEPPVAGSGPVAGGATGRAELARTGSDLGSRIATGAGLLGVALLAVRARALAHEERTR
jgi:hypothetical protein